MACQPRQKAYSSTFRQHCALQARVHSELSVWSVNVPHDGLRVVNIRNGKESTIHPPAMDEDDADMNSSASAMYGSRFSFVW